MAHQDESVIRADGSVAVKVSRLELRALELYQSEGITHYEKSIKCVDITISVYIANGIVAIEIIEMLDRSLNAPDIAAGNDGISCIQ